MAKHEEDKFSIAVMAGLLWVLLLFMIAGAFIILGEGSTKWLCIFPIGIGIVSFGILMENT